LHFDIFAATGGTAGSLLKINNQALDLIKANLASFATLNLLLVNPALFELN